MEQWMNTTKKCPMCAEQIPAEAKSCPYCSTQFGEAGPVVPSTPRPAPSPLAMPYSPPPSYARPAKKSSAWVWILGILLLLAGGYLLIKTGLFRSFTLSFPTATLTATFTRTPTKTPTRTPTKTPTRTPTPMPVEIHFDTIGSYPVGSPVILVGRLSMVSSTYCNHTCGLLLENPANTTQKITIFVTVGDQPSQMKPLPNSYTKSDIQVRLDDGTYAVIGFRIRVTGRICQTTSENPCINDILRIELFQLK
jgi:hypothetical protein